MIGIVLGSMALGVLLGYPFGGILYAFFGKSAPFYIISILTFLTLGKKKMFSRMQRHSLNCSLVLQLKYIDLQCPKNEVSMKSTNYMQFLRDPIIVKIAVAIFISTIAMATLEPCLPIWLMANLKPEVRFNFSYFHFLSEFNF